MPLQNRVQPTGDIIAHPSRGTLIGNRGILHDTARTVKRRWSHPHWIVCTLHWKDVRRVPMTPNRWTELFFLDEAVALAAGHRPCAYCRRADYRLWKAAWEHAFGERAKAAEMDGVLHASRIDKATHTQQQHTANLADLPDGTFILHDGQPHLILGPNLLTYGPDAYALALPKPSFKTAQVLTPAITVAVLRAGYRPVLHPTSQAGQVP